MKRRFYVKFFALFAVISGLLAGCDSDTESHQIAETASTEASVSSALTVHCFSAGKADAFLLYSDAGAVLIDTGESGFGKTIVAYLKEHAITRLDYLIITHFDKDHVGGAKKILESVEVGQVLQSNCPKTDASAYQKYVGALADLSITPVTVREVTGFLLGDVRCTVDPPARETYAQNASNNSSLIVEVVHGKNKLLFTGDAEEARLEEYMAKNNSTFDFVKIPYHGHWQNSLRQLLEQTRPQYAVITSSEEEPEDASVLELLSEYGVDTFLTRNGAVDVVSTSDRLTVNASS